MDKLEYLKVLIDAQKVVRNTEDVEKRIFSVCNSIEQDLGITFSFRIGDTFKIMPNGQLVSSGELTWKN